MKYNDTQNDTIYNCYMTFRNIMKSLEALNKRVVYKYKGNENINQILVVYVVTKY